MGKHDSEYKRYKLYVKDTKGKKIEFFSASTIEEMDMFTSQFEDRSDLLEQMSEHYEVKLVDFFIESKGQNQNPNQPGKIINNIMYSNNIIPSIDKLHELYIKYLLDDRRRIKESYAKYKPKFAKENVFAINEWEIISSVKSKIKEKEYMKLRNIYFELLQNGYINSKKEDNEQKDSLQESIDYLYSLLNKINTDYPDIQPEKLTKEDAQDIYDSIMIDKIRSGEVEPFEYYDLEDYEHMQGRRR